MHGLVNKSIQCFVHDTYGPATWSAVARGEGVGVASFESMLTYDPALTDILIDRAASVLRRPRETLLEDLGTYLVCNPSVTSLRRLLRFGGAGFLDFLHSLEELPDRGRLALPSLTLPVLALTERSPNLFTLRCVWPIRGGAHVMMGLVRAMADDYGALVVLDLKPDPDAAQAARPDDPNGNHAAGEAITIHLLDPGFAEARPFHLAAT